MITGLCSLLNAGPKSVGGLQVNAHPALIETTGNGSLTSGSFTAAHIGGTAAFTYAWSVVHGDPTITITTPTSQTTTTKATVGNGDFKQAILACTIHDNGGLVITTNQVTTQFEFS
jgi:hypothetical protein